MAAQHIGSQGPPARPLRRARYIGVETWNTFKDEVYERYIVQDHSLEKIMNDYRMEYSFPATKKQWKDQLGRWQYRKRLNKEDAAFILFLFEEAARHGVSRRVFVNQSEKTEEDILAYVRKSSLVGSREELLEYLDHDERSPYITWVDEDRELQQQPQEDMPMWQPVDNIEPDFAHSQPDEDDDSHANRPSFELLVDYEELPPVGDVHSIPSDSSAEEEGSSPMGQTREDNALDSTPNRHEPGPPPDVQGSSMGGIRAQLFPPEIPNNAMAQGIDTQRLNGLLSNSPLQANLSPEDLGTTIDAMFGLMEAVGCDAEDQWRVTRFLRLCCAAAIYGGQNFDAKRKESITEAVGIFRELLTLNPWDSVTTLNNMFALLNMYGHRVVIHDILKATKAMTDNVADSFGHTYLIRVVQSVLNFMLRIPETGSKAEYNLDELAEMEELADHSFENHAGFALSATYIHAWGLLEMKRYPEALKKLSDRRAECEEAFDYGQFQTICWIATLARAYAMNDKNRAAVNTYRDVAGRIFRIFTPSHPQYCDSIYRLACFDKRVIDESQDRESQQRGWLSVARTMQRTLAWRAEELGRVNPQTIQNFKALRKVLMKLERASETTTFDEVLMTELS